MLAAMPAGFAPLVVDNGSRDGSSRGGHFVRRDGGLRAARAASARLASPGCSPPRSESSASWTATARSIPASCTVSPTPCSTAQPTSASAPGSPSREPGPWHARLANRALAFELRRRTGAALTDLGPMRAARRDALLSLRLQDRGSGWPLEMVLRAAAENWRIAEVAVTYRAPRRRSLEGQRQRARDRARRTRHDRPAFLTRHPRRTPRCYSTAARSGAKRAQRTGGQPTALLNDSQSAVIIHAPRGRS